MALGWLEKSLLARGGGILRLITLPNCDNVPFPKYLGQPMAKQLQFILFHRVYLNLEGSLAFKFSPNSLETAVDPQGQTKNKEPQTQFGKDCEDSHTFECALVPRA